MLRKRHSVHVWTDLEVEADSVAAMLRVLMLDVVAMILYQVEG